MGAKKQYKTKIALGEREKTSTLITPNDGKRHRMGLPNIFIGVRRYKKRLNQTKPGKNVRKYKDNRKTKLFVSS